MHAYTAVLAAALLALPALSAQAESLRCNGTTTYEGESRLALLHKCGPPHLSQSFCAPVFHAPSLQPVPAPFVGVAVPCQPMEDWVYDRGPGSLMATVRLRGGVIESIRYGRDPQ